MPTIQTVVFNVCGFIVIALTFLLTGCTQTPEERLRSYLNSINAAEGEVPAVVPGPSPSSLPSLSGASAVVSSNGGGGATAIVGGTPRTVKEGFCGDGIINGSTEDCDGGAIQNTACRDYNAVGGVVKCQPGSCLYDISDCITPAVDKHLGGLAETCTCNCNTSPCRGGCQTAAVMGQAVCDFKCDQDCICQCEGKLEAHIEEADIRCACTIAISGNPLCECTLEEAQVLAIITPNISSTLAAGLSSGGH